MALPDTLLYVVLGYTDRDRHYLMARSGRRLAKFTKSYLVARGLSPHTRTPTRLAGESAALLRWVTADASPGERSFPPSAEHSIRIEMIDWGNYDLLIDSYATDQRGEPPRWSAACPADTAEVVSLVTRDNRIDVLKKMEGRGLVGRAAPAGAARADCLRSPPYAIAKEAATRDRAEIFDWVMEMGWFGRAEIIQLMKIAAIYGSRRVVLWCSERIGHTFVGMSAAVASGGYTDLIHWMCYKNWFRFGEAWPAILQSNDRGLIELVWTVVSRARAVEGAARLRPAVGALWSADARVLLARFGGVPVLEWATRALPRGARCRWDSLMSTHAAGRSFEIIRWLAARRHSWNSADLTWIAARRLTGEQLELVTPESARSAQWISALPLAINSAAAAGNLSALRWLYDKWRESGANRRAMDSRIISVAACAGRFDIAEWALDGGAAATHELLAAAAAAGNVRLLGRMFAAEPALRWGEAYLSAVFSGNMRLLEWLRERRVRPPPAVLCCVARYGDLHMLEWLLEDPRVAAAIGRNALACPEAAGRGDLPMLKKLRAAGAPWGRALDYISAVRDRGVRAAVLGWAIDNGCPAAGPARRFTSHL